MKAKNLSGSGLLSGKLASHVRCLLLSAGLSSAGLRALPLLTSMLLLRGEAGIQPWHRRSWWNYRHVLGGRSVLHPWCGCDGSRRSPHVAPPRRGEARAPSPPLDVVRNSLAESSIIARRGDGVPLRVELMKTTPKLPLFEERRRPSK
jgi:hypothetical protein